MSCPKTEHLLQEYFADDLAPLTREEMDNHLRFCDHCSAELEALMLATLCQHERFKFCATVVTESQVILHFFSS